MAKLVRLCAYLMLGAKDMSLHKNSVSNVRYPVVAGCGNLVDAKSPSHYDILLQQSTHSCEYRNRLQKPII